jgi:hypothetical protein
MLCKKKQEFTAAGLIEQRVYEAVGPIDDIDHQSLHFVVVEARYLGPRNDPYGLLTVTSEKSPAAEDREMPACRSSNIELRKQCRTMYFARRCCSNESVMNARTSSGAFMRASRILNMT